MFESYDFFWIYEIWILLVECRGRGGETDYLGKDSIIP